MNTAPEKPKSPVAMVVYALVMAGGGITAFLLAPEGANAVTALIAPGIAAVLMLLCAAMTAALPKSKPLGMIGIHLGMVLPLLFAVGIGMRAVKTGEAVAEYKEKYAEFEAIQTADYPGDETALSAEAFKEWALREAFLEANAAGEVGVMDSPESWAQSDGARGVVDHDKTYLMVTLWVLTAVSVVAFFVILSRRPRAGARGEPLSGPEIETQRDDA